MILTTEQRDVITEGANIAVGRSASTLSMMIGREITIDVPVVELIPNNQLAEFFFNRYADEILGVSIKFNGDISGTSTLFFERLQGKTLVDKLLSEHPDEDDGWDIPTTDFVVSTDKEDQLFSDTDKEALIEMGNIMINGLMGSVSNMLNTVFDYSLPELELHFHFPDKTTENSGEDQFALLLETHFKDKEAEIEGFLTLIFEFGDYTNRFLASIDNIVENSGDDPF